MAAWVPSKDRWATWVLESILFLAFSPEGRSGSPCRWTQRWFGALLPSVLAGSRHAHGLRWWWLQGSDSPDGGRSGSPCKLVKAEEQ